MKINKIINIFVIILVIIICIVTIVYFTRPATEITGEKPVTSNVSAGTIKNPVFGEHIQNLPFGQLNVSIGNYYARLPVYVDNIDAGYVSTGNMLNLKVVEGSHTVKVCSGTVCETVDVNILSLTKTTIDFEERLNRDLPMGSLNVSIGTFNAVLPVSIDNLSSGNVSPGNPLNQVVSPGFHSIKICYIDNCYTEDIEINSGKQTSVDFGSRLSNEVRQADLVVSIGGYDAQQLPIFIDNKSVALASQGTPVTIRVNTGIHEVKVCAGAVCVKELVEAKFGKPNFIDFEEQLKKNVEFVKPTVRILSTSQNGNTLVVELEFINPDTKDNTMTATISCVYSYLNSDKLRVSNSAENKVTKSLKAGSRATQFVNINLVGGTYVIASVPVITNILIK